MGNVDRGYVMRRKRQNQSVQEAHGTLEDHSQILHWCMVLLLEHGGINSLVALGQLHDVELARNLGLNFDAENGEIIDERTVRSALALRYKNLRKTPAQKLSLPQGLKRNVSAFCQVLGADAAEEKILLFAVLLHVNPVLNAVADGLGPLTTMHLFRVLAAVLNVSLDAVSTSLGSRGALINAGILRVDRNQKYDFSNKLEIVSTGFAERMFEPATDPVELLRDRLLPGVPSALNADHYAHMRREFSVLRELLSDALLERRSGVNVLLYGEPGTGKSELVRLMAQLLEVEHFEVSCVDEDGDPISGFKRLMALQAAQTILRQRTTLLLFDEVEDVFNDGGLMQPSTAQKNKGWMNRALENNVVPTLWLSNQVRILDSAFIRRFDLVLEVKQPSRKQRYSMAKNMLGELATEPLLARIAATERLSPAVIQRAAQVTARLAAAPTGKIGQHMGERIPASDMPAVLEMLLDNTLRAQRHCGLNESDTAPTEYDPSFIHADTDLIAVAQGLTANPRGRICLYGPPGTGKTAYGRWLAQQIDRPLMVKRASDLLDPFVGGTEQNMARAFREAAQDGAVLLIDEVDSFLQDRSKATRNWEVSMVNEMLTQMERFEGVFIASTNLVEGLDNATLRRFDLKVKFDFMRPQQSVDMFTQHCKRFTLQSGIKHAAERVRALSTLTPGDFAALSRAQRFKPFASAEELAAALERECQMKPQHAGRRIGF